MSRFTLILVILISTGLPATRAQSPLRDMVRDSLPTVKTPESDSLLNLQGGKVLSQDTLPPSTPKKKTEVVKIADSDLNEQIIYGAVDSQRYDNKSKLMYLFGDAYVKYEDKELDADLIILDMENKIAEAHISPHKKSSKRPTFKDGEKSYEYKGLRYNFETEKGIVFDAVTNEGEFRVHGERTKYVSGGDNMYGNSDVIYNANSLITTCNHPDEPHFGFKTKKLKVVTEKVAVSGPANLQIAGVPTPLWIPFGFFPLTDGTTSGLIFPSGYQFYSSELGFGLSGVGWYFPINDRFHTQIKADIYSRGTLGLYSISNYAKRYKYSGSIDLSYTNRVSEGLTSDRRFQKFSDKSFSINISHRQDNKAHPYRTIGGNVRIVGNKNEQRKFQDAASNLTSQYTSNLNFAHTMPRTPFSFRMGIKHDQNTNTGKMNITLPDIALTMRTINPLERKNAGGNEKRWYEKLALGYNSKLKVMTTTSDTTLFQKETIENMKSGIQHRLNLSLPAKIFNYINITPNVNYTETWVLNTIENKVIDSQPFIPSNKADTMQFDLDGQYTFVDSLESKVLSSGGIYRNYGGGISLNTQIFGTKVFSKGKIRGIRHLMKPRIGWSYAPDYSDRRDTIIYDDGRPQRLVYSKFDNGPFGSPGFSDLQSSINYGIDNVIEMKYFSKKDSTEKKFKLFDRINIGGNYNVAADSLKFSTHSVQSTSRFLGGITVLESRWVFDPYMEINTRRTNKTVWAERKKIARLENGNINLTTRFTFGKLRDWLTKDEEERAEDAFNAIDEDPDGRNLAENGGFADSPVGTGAISGNPQDHFGHDHDHDHDHEEDRQIPKRSILDLLDKVAIRHEMRYNFYSDDNIVSREMRTHSLSITGSFDITENWYVNIGSIGYDFIDKGPIFSTLEFVRRLHCWDMRVRWTPVGRDNSYTFFIGVTSNTLGFLKYNYGENPIEGFRP